MRPACTANGSYHPLERSSTSTSTGRGVHEDPTIRPYEHGVYELPWKVSSPVREPVQPLPLREPCLRCLYHPPLPVAVTRFLSFSRCSTQEHIPTVRTPSLRFFCPSLLLVPRPSSLLCVSIQTRYQKSIHHASKHARFLNIAGSGDRQRGQSEVVSRLQPVVSVQMKGALTMIGC